jgi:hypothetical protein
MCSWRVRWAAARGRGAVDCRGLSVLGHRQQLDPTSQPPNPLQISAPKVLGAGLPMPAIAHLQGDPIPLDWINVAILGIGSLGYGVSIWLDMVALVAPGAARGVVGASPLLPSSVGGNARVCL